MEVTSRFGRGVIRAGAWSGLCSNIKHNSKIFEINIKINPVIVPYSPEVLSAANPHFIIRRREGRRRTWERREPREMSEPSLLRTERVAERSFSALLPGLSPLPEEAEDC